MKAIILEDELIAAKRLTRLLNEIAPEVEVEKTFESVMDTAEYLMNNEMPDILFLDVQVMDGLSLELFDVVDIKSKVIFTTAYDAYAVEAFRKNAIDYLLKPIKKEELKEAISRVKELDNQLMSNLNNELSHYKKRFLIKFGARLHTVATTELAYIYSENKLSYFITQEGKRIVSDLKLRDIMESLNPEEFFRANRQFIVHLSSIKEMVSHTKSRIKLKLEPPYSGQIVVSTETTPVFKEWLNR